MIPALIGEQALFQGRDRVTQQLCRAALYLRRLGALGTEGCRSLGAFLGEDFARRLASQVGQVECLVAPGRCRIGREAGDVCGNVPALALIQLVGKGRHVRAVDTQPQGVVQVVEAEPVKALDTLQVGWRRHQAQAGGAITGAGIAMADRTVLRIQGGTTRRVRRNDRCLADLISQRQLCAQLPSLTCHRRPVLFVSDRFVQIGNAVFKRLALGTGRQCRDQAMQGPGEFQLFAVLRVVRDVTRIDRGRVVGADVVE
ncbi:hypothetical protein D3C85_1064500 [compost metagenome]